MDVALINLPILQKQFSGSTGIHLRSSLPTPDVYGLVPSNESKDAVKFSINTQLLIFV